MLICVDDLAEELSMKDVEAALETHHAELLTARRNLRQCWAFETT
jgi:hypothetical protein